LRSRFQDARHAVTSARAGTAQTGRGGAGLFNRDTVGLPQNEESISSCANAPRTVLGGTNDCRFLLDPQANSTGWHFSTDGGRTVANEGLLPALTAPNGTTTLPSGGDPVDAAGSDCGHLYAASLNYDFTQPFPFPSGVGVYRSDPGTLASCPQGRSDGGLTNPSCWPTRKLIDFAAPGRFLEGVDGGRPQRVGRRGGMDRLRRPGRLQRRGQRGVGRDQGRPLLGGSELLHPADRAQPGPDGRRTEADPILGGTFIGDYFQFDANAGRVYVHYNGNFRQVPLVGEGVPIPQQDNFLAVRGE
jgi:hypothetical protein